VPHSGRGFSRASEPPTFERIPPTPSLTLPLHIVFVYTQEAQGNASTTVQAVYTAILNTGAVQREDLATSSIQLAEERDTVCRRGEREDGPVVSRW
jgi:hypothetical protein